MGDETQNGAAVRGQTRNVGLPTIAAVLVAVMPKCPLCWVALTGALGVGSAVSFSWLRPLAVTLLLLSVGALLVHARRRRGYGPPLLGLVAAAALYLFKFGVGYDAGVYLSGAALLGASVWNALPKRRAAGDAGCHCAAGPRGRRPAHPCP